MMQLAALDSYSIGVHGPMNLWGGEHTAAMSAHPPDIGTDGPHWTTERSHPERTATGFPASLFAIDQVLDSSDGPTIFTAHDDEHHYLVLQIAHDEARRIWMLAPLSERALECAVSGRADLRDVFLHTVTGTVELFTATATGEITESVQLCSSLGDEVLPTPGWHLAA